VKTFLFLSLIAGCSAPPEGTSQDTVSDFMLAASTIGCELVHDSDYAPVEFQTGITREQALEITGFLIARGDAVSLPEGGVRITSGPCTTA
ncbi:MAG: hypothetical protein AAFU56_10970, partial [Pseudomonadota bacterium]